MIKVRTHFAASPLNKYRRRFIKVTAEHVLRMMFGKNYDSTDLTINFVSMGYKMPWKKNDPHTLGYANATGRHNITIHLNNERLQTVGQMMSTVAHELAHAKQYYLGDLRIKHNSIYFRGVRYPMVKIHKHGLDWRIRPWEMEAIELEEFYMSKLDENVIMEETLAK